MLTSVLNAAQEHINRQISVIALSALTFRYYINTSTEQAEKMAVMAHISAQKGKDQLFQLVSGKLLAGMKPPTILPATRKSSFCLMR